MTDPRFYFCPQSSCLILSMFLFVSSFFQGTVRTATNVTHTPTERTPYRGARSSESEYHLHDTTQIIAFNSTNIPLCYSSFFNIIIEIVLDPQ